MKTLPLCLFILLCVTPLHAAQALVLTELEQLQEKIWYLTKDIAEQKILLEKQQKQLSSITSGNNKKQQEQEERLSTLVSEIASHQEKISKAEKTFSEMDVLLTNLLDEVGQQEKIVKEQADKALDQDQLIQTLRTEVSSYRSQTDKAIAETRSELDKIRSTIETIGKDAGKSNERIIWLIAGAVLLLAIVLTFFIALSNRKHLRQTHRITPPADHEM